MVSASQDFWSKVHQKEWGRLVAGLIRITGDWALAEDCVQEAFTKAWQHWGAESGPEKPGAWLATVARNLALDKWRRDRAEEERLPQLAADAVRPESDDRLALMFTCCHPSLSLEGRVALTLKSVAGLSTAQVARAFLVSEDTMTRRLTRARTKITEAGIPFRVPDDPLLPSRLQGVLGVLYLLFNHGNDAGPNDPDRAWLADEAIALARLLRALLPTETETKGALALLLLTRARRPARFDSGRPVTLEKQNRALWDKAINTEGLALLDEALLEAPGPYTLQAAISGCHARAANAEATDFSLIAGLYRRLEALTPTPVVRLNRAVAVGLAEGPGAGLALLEELADEPSLERYCYLPAARADLLAKAGRYTEAAAQWSLAAQLANEETERRFFEERAREALTASGLA